MRWLVAVPDYAGQITTPGGGHGYGFAGINALRDVFTWLGVAAAPLTLVYATSRALIGDGDPIGIPVLRMLATAVVIISYPYWWSQAAALADQVTNAILSVPAVAAGLQRLMEYAVGGVALGGWQLIDLGLMARDRLGAARADLSQGRRHPARRALVRDRAGDDRPGAHARRQRAGPRLGQRRRRAAGARDRVGIGVRRRRGAHRRLGDRRPADRRQQQLREPGWRTAAGRGGRGQPVDLPQGGQGSRRPAAHAARRIARLHRERSAGNDAHGLGGGVTDDRRVATGLPLAARGGRRCRGSRARARRGRRSRDRRGGTRCRVCRAPRPDRHGRDGSDGRRREGGSRWRPGDGALARRGGRRAHGAGRHRQLGRKRLRNNGPTGISTSGTRARHAAQRQPVRARAARAGGADHEEPAAQSPKAPRQPVGATADRDRQGDGAPSRSSASDGPRQPPSDVEGPDRGHLGAAQTAPARRGETSPPSVSPAPGRAGAPPSSTTKARGATPPPEPGARDRTPRPGSEQ